MCVLSHCSRVRLSVTLWTLAHQAPLSMGFSRQEYCRGLPWTPPGDLPDPGIEFGSLKCPALAGGLFTTSATWEALAAGKPGGWGKTGAALKVGSPQGQRLKSLGVKDWDLRREREDQMLGDPKEQISMGKKVTGRCDKSF